MATWAEEENAARTAARRQWVATRYPGAINAQHQQEMFSYDWELAWAAARAAFAYERQQEASRALDPQDVYIAHRYRAQGEDKRQAWVKEVGNVNNLLDELYMYRFNREMREPDLDRRVARAVAWLRTLLREGAADATA